MNQTTVDKITLASIATVEPAILLDFRMDDWVRHSCQRYIRRVSHVDSSSGSWDAMLYFDGVYGEIRRARDFLPVNWRVGEIYLTSDEKVTARVERIVTHDPPPQDVTLDFRPSQSRQVVLAALHGGVFFGHVRAFDSRTGKHVNVKPELLPHGSEQQSLAISDTARSLQIIPLESFQSRSRLPISPEWLLAIGGHPLLSGEIVFESTGRDGPGYHNSKVWKVSCNPTNSLCEWTATMPHGDKKIRLPTPEDRGEAIDVLRAFRFIPTA